MVKYLYDSLGNTYGSQTADVMALDLGLVPEGHEKAVADAVVRNMNHVSEGFINCGIFGITRIGSMLARNGNPGAAWEIFTKKGENSFDWMLNTVGATTLWEALPVNKLTEQTAAAASHSHPMQAGYDLFFYEDIAGIRPDPSGYGFKVIRFDPLLTDFLPWAKASIESPYGTIVSDWKNEEEILNWTIAIPPNSSGLVVLPGNKNITVNGKDITTLPFEVVSEQPESNVYRFPAGHFEIIVKSR
ncbi:MAG: alpha-L-rhamnosidase C-terminal domain-containing protein, partial [Prolixibacteraceae bacterium]|nr:alpha-L-rhamnosidase C-terminal domain-containing protein [Prolixibacteraceae bacterium]